MRAEVQNLLARLRRESNHDLDVIAHMCETIFVMVHGRFVEQLTREDLVAGRVSSALARGLLEASRVCD